MGPRTKPWGTPQHIIRLLEIGEFTFTQVFLLAEHGFEASKRRGVTIGLDGKDLIIPVPGGISVLFGGQGNCKSLNGFQMNENKVLGHLDAHGQTLLVSKGGMGGLPQTEYLGTPGQAHSIILDLKLMSDFALIGFPNAGKSSLLKAVSGAPTKIASYPFTTIRPQIAYCKYPDHRLVSLTDLPGLSDIYAYYSNDKSKNETSTNQDGVDYPLPVLRHTNFLKHVERSSCLILVLDAFGFCRDQYSEPRSPLAVAYLVLHLLERWSHGVLLEKPIACVLNKIDLPGALDIAKETKYWLERMHTDEAKNRSGLSKELIPRYIPSFKAIELVSATSGTNIEDLKRLQRVWLDDIELSRRKKELKDKDELEYSKEITSLVGSRSGYNRSG